MNDDRKREPSERLNTILSAGNEESEDSPPKPQSQPESKPQSKSLLDQLPHAKKPAAPPEPVPEATVRPPSLQPALPKKEKQVPPEQESAPPAATQEMPRREKFLRTLWTVASAISMTVTLVVCIALVGIVWMIRDFKPPENLSLSSVNLENVDLESIDVMMVNDLLSGLYTNFEKMDRATIDTVIAVDAPIPLDINVPVQKTTLITLAESVNIPNAQVVINTGGLNINSTARVTLPAGTPLMVNLNFDLPVQDTIDVHLDVPVKIPMADTELHEPFVGLQDVVRPLYCLVEPAAASSITGEPVCAE